MVVLELFGYRMLACSAAFSRVSQPVVMPGTKALHASPSKTALPAGSRASTATKAWVIFWTNTGSMSCAVTIPRTGPYDPQAIRRYSALCLQDLDGPPTHSAGIIFPPADRLHDIALVPIGTGALIIEATVGQIMCRVEPQLL